MKTFTEIAKEKLNTLNACNSDTAVLAHLLSQAIDKLEMVIAQADAQFKVGDRHATFNKHFIENLKQLE